MPPSETHVPSMTSPASPGLGRHTEIFLDWGPDRHTPYSAPLRRATIATLLLCAAGLPLLPGLSLQAAFLLTLGGLHAALGLSSGAALLVPALRRRRDARLHARMESETWRLAASEMETLLSALCLEAAERTHRPESAWCTLTLTLLQGRARGGLLSRLRGRLAERRELDLSAMMEPLGDVDPAIRARLAALGRRMTGRLRPCLDPFEAILSMSVSLRPDQVSAHERLRLAAAREAARSAPPRMRSPG